MSINRILADLGKAVDSSSTGNFLNKEASGAEFNPVQWSDINSAPTILDSALASAIVDSAYVQARQTGVGGGGLDSATTISLIDSDYVGARASTGGSGFTKYQYTATASQTTFQDSDANGNVLSYDADYILVHYNGVLLPSADYTATDGSSVVLGTGADSGSIIGIAKWGAAAGSSSGGSSVSFYGDRGLYAGGTSGSTDQIEYISISSTANASDFGDLTVARGQMATASNGTYATWASGYEYGNSALSNIIDYVTVATPSNATDFGDLVYSANATFGCGVGDGTYGFKWMGYLNPGWTTAIDYWTMDTPSNASDFGDNTRAHGYTAGSTDGTYALIAGGYSGGDGEPYRRNNIDYFTTATPSNASDFGDLTVARQNMGAVYDTTRSVFAAGWLGGESNVIDYVTTATPGNATDFGDLTTGEYPAGTTDGTYGCFATGTGLGVNIHKITIQTPGNAADTGFDLITNYSNGGAGVSGSPS